MGLYPSNSYHEFSSLGFPGVGSAVGFLVKSARSLAKVAVRFSDGGSEDS
jgi:hypothetical protein